MRITRRGLLLSAAAGGGAMLMGTVGLGMWVGAYDRRARQQDALGSSVRMMTQWIRIDDDDTVTLLGPHTEMGQGTQTSLLQIVLDELSADPAKTRYELAPADPAFTHSDAIQGMLAGEQDLSTWSGSLVEKLFGRVCELGGVMFTGGSMAVRYTGWRGIRRSAACARMMLVEAAADQLGVDPSELTTDNSAVVHAATGQRIGYGALAAAAVKLPIPERPVYKKPGDWKYIATAYPRIDIPEKVFGEPVYGIDTAVPGMRYAAIAPPPLAQGRVTGVANVPFPEFGLLGGAGFSGFAEANVGLGRGNVLADQFDARTQAAQMSTAFSVYYFFCNVGSFGGYQGIMYDAKNDVYYGASESRKDGQAAGY